MFASSVGQNGNLFSFSYHLFRAMLASPSDLYGRGPFPPMSTKSANSAPIVAGEAGYQGQRPLPSSCPSSDRPSPLRMLPSSHPADKGSVNKRPALR